MGSTAWTTARTRGGIDLDVGSWEERVEAGFALGVRYIYVPPRTRLTDHVRGWLNESQLAPAADRDRAWRAVMARDVRLLERSAPTRFSVQHLTERLENSHIK